MDHYSLNFRFKENEDRKKGREIDQKIDELLKDYKIVEESYIKGNLNSFLNGGMIGLQEVEYEKEGIVKVSSLNSVEIYGKAVFLSEFDENDQEYSNWKRQLGDLGFQYNEQYNKQHNEEDLEGLEFASGERKKIMKALRSLEKMLNKNPNRSKLRGIKIRKE